MNVIVKSTVLVFLIAVVLFFVNRGMFVFAALVPAFLLGCRLLTVREPLIYWAMFAEFSMLTVPATAIRTFSVAFLLQFIFVGGEILNHLAGKDKLKYPVVSKCLFAFLALLALTAKIRGFGLYMLGGSSIGGVDYIILGTRIAFIAFVVAYASTYQMDIKKLYRFVLAGALVYFAFNMVVYFVPALKGSIGKFCHVLFAADAERAAERIAQGQVFERRIYALYYLPFALMPYVMRQTSLRRRILLGMCCVLLSALSGFRTAVVITGSLFVLAEIFIYKVNLEKGLLATVILAVFLGGSWVVLPSMDSRIQRSFTMIPGFKNRVPAEVRLSAEHSTEWRTTLYGICLEHLPQYWLIGRGLGEEISVTMNRLQSYGYRALGLREGAEYAYEYQIYHLAVFDLFLKYGGVAGSLFVVAMFLLLQKGRRRLSGQEESILSDEKYALACLTGMLLGMLTYFSDFSASFLNMIMCGAVSVAFICHGVPGGKKSSNKHVM